MTTLIQVDGAEEMRAYIQGFKDGLLRRPYDGPVQYPPNMTLLPLLNGVAGAYRAGYIDGAGSRN